MAMDVEARNRHPRAYAIVQRARRLFVWSAVGFGVSAIAGGFLLIVLIAIANYTGLSQGVVTLIRSLFLIAIGGSLLSSVLSFLTVLLTTAFFFFRYTLRQMLCTVLLLGLSVALALNPDESVRTWGLVGVLGGVAFVVLSILNQNPALLRSDADPDV